MTPHASNYKARDNQEAAGEKFQFFAGEVLYHCPQGKYLMDFSAPEKSKGWCHTEIRTLLHGHHHFGNDLEVRL